MSSVIKLAVFDMAGTVIEDKDAVYKAFEATLIETGTPFSEEEIRSSMGTSKREVFGRLVERELGPDQQNESRVEEIYQVFIRSLDESFASEARPIEGVEQVFSELREQGIKIALSTGFGRETQSSLLATLGWNEGVVDATVCSDDVLLGRPAPYMIFHAMESTSVFEVERVLVAGDTSLDLNAGINAGAGMVVGVLSGAHNIDQLGKAQHSHIIASISDLPEIL